MFRQNIPPSSPTSRIPSHCSGAAKIKKKKGRERQKTEAAAVCYVAAPLFFLKPFSATEREEEKREDSIEHF